MSRWLALTLLLLVVLVAALLGALLPARAEPIPPPLPGLTHCDEQGVSRLCFYGIMPGKTTRAEANRLLSAIAKTNPLTYDIIQITDGSVTAEVTVFTKQDVVSNLIINIMNGAENQRIGQAINFLGRPCTTYGFNAGANNRVASGTYYSGTSNHIVYLGYSAASLRHLSPATSLSPRPQRQAQITVINLSTPTDCATMQRTFSPWHGFGPYPIPNSVTP
jgi:hypothetical protein